MIVRELGHGAMGQVYLAEDSVLARAIAIKFIGVDPDPAARQRFLMEARAAARIQHPNVVSIYRVGELGDRPYIVSELVRGTSLVRRRAADGVAERARRSRSISRAGSPRRTAAASCTATSSPSNVMMTEDGVAKLVDFGLRADLREGSDERVAAAVGTPDYMAPEVWSGKPPTRRSDVYSLGAVMYELLSRRAAVRRGRADRARPHDRERDAPRARRRAAARRARRALPGARSGAAVRERRGAARSARAAARVAHADRRASTRTRIAACGRSSRRIAACSSAAGSRSARSSNGCAPSRSCVVAGDSGVGKSSLCRAGVVPAVVDGALGGGRTLARDHRGARPPAAGRARRGARRSRAGGAACSPRPGLLARELHRRAGNGGLILFVDQMEELVTVGDPAEVAAFDAALARISEGVAGVRLITTVRADFLSRLVALPRFGRELSRVLYFVRPLPPERLRDVITGPGGGDRRQLRVRGDDRRAGRRDRAGRQRWAAAAVVRARRAVGGARPRARRDHAGDARRDGRRRRRARAPRRRGDRAGCRRPIARTRAASCCAW